jgi:tetratricopeptide (TPR) repeat protein
MRINLRKQLKGNPSDASLINKLAIVELGLHKDYEAFRFFKKAAKVKPGVQSLNNLAWFYLYNPEAGYDANKAIDLLQDTLELNPKSEFPYCLLGEAYLKANKPIEAKEILEKAIVLKSDFVTLNNLGVAFYKLGLIEEASERLLLAHKAQKDKIESLLPYFNYGICQAELFNKANANKVLNICSSAKKLPNQIFMDPK